MSALRTLGAVREPESLPVNILYAPRNLMPLKLRTFLDWMTPRLKNRLNLA